MFRSWREQGRPASMHTCLSILHTCLRNSVTFPGYATLRNQAEFTRYPAYGENEFLEYAKVQGRGG